VLFGGETVVDSTRVMLLHETKHLPVYYFPEDDVRRDLLEPSERPRTATQGTARYWSIRGGGRTAPDAIWEYPEPIAPASFSAAISRSTGTGSTSGSPKTSSSTPSARPYSRIDVYRTSRHARVLLDGEAIADSVRAKVLFETDYRRVLLPPEDVRIDLLEPRSKRTHCAYKGSARTGTSAPVLPSTTTSP